MDSAKGQTRSEEPTPAQRAVVRRAAEARATVPDFELDVEIDMERCLELRQQRPCSITAILVKACAVALRDVPRANGAYRDGRFELFSRVNVGIVVAGEGAYLIPTVFDADRKSLEALSEEIDGLRRQAGEGQLSSPAFSGATFTLANLGAHGVRRATLIPNPPQAAVASAGQVRQVPVVRGQAVRPGHVMTMTLACDQRILYPQQAARFLGSARTALETADL